MRYQSSIISTVILLVISMGCFCEAEAITIAAGHATVSWKGTGVIDDLGDGDRVFSGTINGTILVKHLPEGSTPAQVHKAKMNCQAILHISEHQAQPKTVLCILRAHEDKDLAYGEVRHLNRIPGCGSSLKGGRKGFAWIDTLLDNSAVPSPDRHAFGTEIQHRHAIRRSEWCKCDVLTMWIDRDGLFRVHVRPAPGGPERTTN